MKKQILAFSTSAMLLLTGCLVTSVAPFYTTKDLAFEPALLGDWSKASEQDEHWNFERDGTNAYRLAVGSGGKTNLMQAHLFKLQGQAFLDLYSTEIPDDIQPPPIPAHYLLRVVQVTPTLRMAPMDYDWLKSLLEKRPKALRHHVILSGAKSEDTRVVLTADTPELQRFLIKHLQTAEAWKEELELKRN